MIKEVRTTKELEVLRGKIENVVYYNETNDYRPMYGKDGSAVYLDDENWQIVRKANGKLVKIANVVAYC